MTNRPHHTESSILRAAAQTALSEFQKWFSDSPPSNLLQMIEDAARDQFCGLLNGYELAKEWDNRFMISPDSELVELLQNLQHHLETARRKAVEAWVEENHIKEPFPIGTAVTIEIRGKAVDGEIVKQYPKTAESVVYCPSEGHVLGTQLGTHGYIMAWEKMVREGDHNANEV